MCLRIKMFSTFELASASTILNLSQILMFLVQRFVMQAPRTHLCRTKAFLRVCDRKTRSPVACSWSKTKFNAVKILTYLTYVLDGATTHGTMQIADLCMSNEVTLSMSDLSYLVSALYRSTLMYYMSCIRSHWMGRRVKS